MLIHNSFFQFEEKGILNQKNRVAFFSEPSKVISGVLKVMALKTHGDFEKSLYVKVIYSRLIWQIKGHWHEVVNIHN